MQRVTISLDNDLAARLDAAVRERAYASRSEALRDLVRRSIEVAHCDDPAGQCVASLSYAVTGRTRDLSARLAALRHARHDLVVTTTAVVLDHDEALETVILRGSKGEVTAFADRVIAERGVRFGAINVIGVETHDNHNSPTAHHHHGKAHASPRPG